MGRPYRHELQELTSTYSSAFSGVASNTLARLLVAHASTQWCFVGSGGAYSAARYMASAYEHVTGRIARIFTPQDLLQHRELLAGAMVAIVSASGNNKDIVAAFETAVESDAEHVVTITASATGKIARAASVYSHSSSIVVALGGKKDGFLALNSILSFAVTFAKACHVAYGSPVIPADMTDILQDLPQDLVKDAWQHPLFDRDVFCVLHGSSTHPAAVDFESKATEAGLVASLVSDHRNFGHGRHHWLAKHGEQTGLLAFCDQSDRRICERTLDLIPKQIPRILIAANGDFLAAGITGLLATFHAIHHIGSQRHIDPGRPGVPSFGSKIYSLGPQLLLRGDKRTRDEIAIGRKALALGIPQDSPSLQNACRSTVAYLETTTFGGLVLDYDGTIVSRKDRQGTISKTIGEHLARLVSAGVPLAICTGRGKSVQYSLTNIIPRAYWDRVLVCLYNGSVWCSLAEDASQSASLHAIHAPEIADTLRLAIAAFHVDLQDAVAVYGKRVELTLRDYQITIQTTGIQDLVPITCIVQRLLLDERHSSLKCLASAHSLDVIPRATSKRQASVVARQFFRTSGTHRFLSFGDMPSWPGNDCELLSGPDGLSVGRSSPSLKGGWNFSSSEARSDLALAEYLSCVTYRRGALTISLSTLGQTP